MKQLIKLSGIALAIAISQSAWAGAGEDCHFHGKKPAAKETVLKCADAFSNPILNPPTPANNSATLITFFFISSVTYSL